MTSKRSPMITTASKTIKTVVDFLMPLACVHCGVEGSLLCEKCIGGAVQPPSNTCVTCAEPTFEDVSRCGECAALPPPLDRLVPIFRYGGAVRSAVHALKYRNITAIAPVIAGLISQHPYSGNARIDCVTPVPIHAERLRERGYNQAALLAEHVAGNRQLLFIPEALSKTRATASQVDLTKQERATSLRGAFAANFDFDDAHVLLVDDVCTTGNTLMNCAAALKRAGARRVSAMVFAKETIDNEAQV